MTLKDKSPTRWMCLGTESTVIGIHSERSTQNLESGVSPKVIRLGLVGMRRREKKGRQWYQEPLAYWGHGTYDCV